MTNYLVIKLFFVSTLLLFSVAEAQDSEVKEWTFFVFLNANNNLDNFGDTNIKQMEEVGSNDKINILVQRGSLRQKTVQRLLIKKSSNPDRITSPVIEDIGDADMGDVNEFTKFLKWGHEKFPAKRYFISIWNHGNGWHIAKNRDEDFRTRDISYDDKTGNKITTEQLGVALQGFSTLIKRKIDLYASDACLMSMAEVAGQMLNSVNYFAGSQEVEPPDGWPYKELLTEWNKEPSMEADKLAKLLSTEYLKAYSGGVYGEENVTFSVFNLAKLPQFTNSVKGLVKGLQALPSRKRKKILSLALETQTFANSDYKDFGHFVSLLDEHDLISQSMKGILIQTLRELVIDNSVSGDLRDVHGLSIWLPESSWQLDQYRDRYSKLDFNTNSNWLKLLDILPYR